jgi:hypothetical protein
MIDALLLSVVDAVRNAGLGYDYATANVTGPDGRPPPRCGAIFVAVHQGVNVNEFMNSLNDYFDFSITLTMRVVIPFDRIGDQLLAVKTAQEKGFNRRCNALKDLLHMNWGMLQDANNYLVTLMPEAPTIYGFCEPAHFANMEVPTFVGSDWFLSEPDDMNVGLKSKLSFTNARRMQAIAVYT